MWWARGLGIVFLVVGCNGGDDDKPVPQPGACFDYTGWDGSSPTVSLETDLLGDLAADGKGGLMRRACGLGSCHGDMARPEENLFLGPPLRIGTQAVTITPSEITAVETNVIRKPSVIAPGLLRVVPGDPANSFLMMKVDGCLESVRDQCTKPPPDVQHPCGDRMPERGSMLPAAERDMLRRWIAQLPP